MRKAIVSIGTGPQQGLLRMASRSFRPYAARHGYDLHLHAEPLVAERPVPWSKVELLRRLNESYDVLVWLDADLVVVDGRRDILDDLPEDRLFGLVEHRTADGQMPNSGVLVIRCGDEAERFLANVWAQEDLITHQWWENAAVCRLLGYELDPVGPGEPTALLRDRVTFLDPRWNSIPSDPARAPFIRHFPGYAPRTRSVLMAASLVEMTARRTAAAR
ncbi:unannotated protein [freshwater metagenome]|uniref:Unannotated protein n=1 Tax=freshwater metagenome TaxID=449393 RepID=A0A6J7GCQ1_9ZZZZ|nr:hypothetical protein [Actinomycetota bacterium]